MIAPNPGRRQPAFRGGCRTFAELASAKRDGVMLRRVPFNSTGPKRHKDSAGAVRLKTGRQTRELAAQPFLKMLMPKQAR